MKKLRKIYEYIGASVSRKIVLFLSCSMFILLLGIVSVFSSASIRSIFISTIGGQSFTKFNTLLIGDILSVSPMEIGLLAIILLLVVVLWLTSFNQMMLASVHQALADSRGIRVMWKNFLLTAAIAVVVTITMSWVGLLVINALLVLPGAAARNVAKNLPQYHLISILSGLICGILGLLLSYYMGASTGASITILLAVWFFLSLLFRGKR